MRVVEVLIVLRLMLRGNDVLLFFLMIMMIFWLFLKVLYIECLKEMEGVVRDLLFMIVRVSVIGSLERVVEVLVFGFVVRVVMGGGLEVVMMIVFGFFFVVLLKSGNWKFIFDCVGLKMMFDGMLFGL